MKTAYAYARFSSDNQREESIDAQLRAIREYCAKNDIIILKEFVDEAVSARTDKRPAFQRMFGLIKDSRADFVVVHKLDRFARSRADDAFYRAKLKEAGMKLVSVLERLDDSPESIIMEGLLASLNEYYSANLARETLKGLKENALNGKWNGGKPPFGYKVVNRRLEPDENAKLVTRMFRDYAQGAKYEQIMSYIPRTDYAIHLMLKNEVYLGTLIYAKGKEYEVRIENDHEPLTDEGTFALCQKRLNEAPANARNKAKRVILLSGLLTCPTCGKKMVAQGGVGYYYYACRNKCMKPIRSEAIEAEVINQMKIHLAPTDDIKARIYELACERVNNRADIEKAKKAKYIWSQQVSNTMAALKECSDERVREFIVKELSDLLKKEPEIPREKTPISKDEVDRFVDSYFNLDGKTPVEVKEILNKALQEIVVYPDKLEFVLNTSKGGGVNLVVFRE